MKITIITETYLPFIAGVSASTDNIARFLAGKGHQVTVICPHPVLPQIQKEKQWKLVYTPSFPDFFFKGKPMSLWPLPFPTMIREITLKKADIIHVQEAGALGVAAFIIAKIRHVPVVGALHLTPEQIIKIIKFNPFDLARKLIINFLLFFYNHCQAIMVPTATFKKMLEEIGVKKPILVVSNGVDTEKFTPGEKHPEIIQKYNLPASKILFFYLGRLDKDKNIDTIINALPFASSKVHLVIAGQGAYEEELRKLTDKIQVNDRITWLGHIPEEDIVKLYQCMDCFILMSPYEVQSIVTLQAIACGLPVICSNEGALPELCHDGENGFLVDTYDSQTLAQKMDILAGDEPLRKKFSGKSREISLPHERSQNFAKLETLYQNLTKP